jgi:hypothetical protein
MPQLAHCDTLFQKFFDRWYSDDDRQRKGFPATRPDLIQVAEYVGLSASQITPLTRRARVEVAKQIRIMQDAAYQDWKTYLAVNKPMSLRWIDAFDKHYDQKRVRAVIKASDPSDFSNQYLILCCEFGASLGHVFCRLNRRLRWLLDWPYWESAVFDPKSGQVIPVFHWAIKKMSGYGVDDGYAAKVQACLQILDRKRSPGRSKR